MQWRHLKLPFCIYTTKPKPYFVEKLVCFFLFTRTPFTAKPRVSVIELCVFIVWRRGASSHPPPYTCLFHLHLPRNTCLYIWAIMMGTKFAQQCRFQSHQFQLWWARARNKLGHRHKKGGKKTSVHTLPQTRNAFWMAHAICVKRSIGQEFINSVIHLKYTLGLCRIAQRFKIKSWHTLKDK